METIIVGGRGRMLARIGIGMAWDGKWYWYWVTQAGNKVPRRRGQYSVGVVGTY